MIDNQRGQGEQKEEIIGKNKGTTENKASSLRTIKNKWKQYGDQ